MKSKNLQITDFTLVYFITHLVCKLITGKCYLIKLIMFCGAVLLTYLIKNFSIYVIYHGMTIVNEAHKRYKAKEMKQSRMKDYALRLAKQRSLK